MTPKTIRGAVAAVAAFASCVMIEPDVAKWGGSIGPLSQAEARIGRPLTPLSVAGVARRTTRRVVRRSTIYAATLPGGCAAVTVNGARYHRCGATYYAPYQGRYVVVYID